LISGGGGGCVALLHDGRVLATDIDYLGAGLAEAQLYDPATGHLPA
jgi:hypothetical protein